MVPFVDDIVVFIEGDPVRHDYVVAHVNDRLPGVDDMVTSVKLASSSPAAGSDQRRDGPTKTSSFSETVVGLACQPT
jgi:hypothetical protein